MNTSLQSKSGAPLERNFAPLQQTLASLFLVSHRLRASADVQSSHCTCFLPIGLVDLTCSSQTPKSVCATSPHNVCLVIQMADFYGAVDCASVSVLSSITPEMQVLRANPLTLGAVQRFEPRTAKFFILKGG